MQKSITSYFSRKPLKPKEDNADIDEGKTTCDESSSRKIEKANSDTEDSPVKSSKRRKQQILSDSEDEKDSSEVKTAPDAVAKKSKQTNSEGSALSNSDKTTKMEVEDSTDADELKDDFSLKLEESDVESEDKKLANKSESITTKTPVSKDKGKSKDSGNAKKTPKGTSKKKSNSETQSGKKRKSKDLTPQSKGKSKIAKVEPSSTSPNKSSPKSTSPKKSSETDESKQEKEKQNQKPSLLVGKDTDPNSEYDPSTGLKYHPINDATWKKGEKVPYMAFARTLDAIESVSSRLKIIEILANYLRSVILLSPDDLLPSVYLCLNQLTPAYEGLELGIADQNLMKAIAQTTGRTLAQVKADVQETGDFGVVAEKSKSNQRMMFQPAKLTVRGVYDRLKEIAQMTGSTSQSKKIDKIQSMFVACRQVEARFLIRSLAGKLRIGLAEQSVLQALAHACVMTPPEKEFDPENVHACKGMSAESLKSAVNAGALILKTTYCECPNYDKIIPVLLKTGLESLPEHCRLTPGVPLKPMLAHPTKGVQEVLKRFDGLKFTCEWKYDGERAQIHLAEDGAFSIYSRNQENNTSKYPDIISRLTTKNCFSDEVKSFVLDSEAVGWDREKKQILPFQILSTRKRKDANEGDIKVHVHVYAFDLLYLNGEPLVTKPLSERRRLLREHFREVEGEFSFASHVDANTMEEVQDFLDISVKANCEGLMVKTLEEDATYEIAKRSRNWLKLKKDYLDGCGDTLDLVVIGGYVGAGKRTGLYGGFLLACYDPDNEEYQSICKIGTGFSDEDLANHSAFFKEHKIDKARPYYRYDGSHEPDHWFDAVQVWEVKCADLSLSPVHRAANGMVEGGKGISLRFPRFLRIRDDKSVENATSAKQVVDMYKNQDQIKNQNADKEINEEDYY